MDQKREGEKRNGKIRGQMKSDRTGKISNKKEKKDSRRKAKVSHFCAC